ncbi:MAG: 3-dehydroquinate synthase [Candidatus Sumerlaeaceae bacterium]
MDEASMMPAVHVELGDRSYDIQFYRGNVDQMARDIVPFCPERALVVSNEPVWQAHGAPMVAALRQAGIPTTVHLMGDGERHKNLESITRMYDQLIAERYSRKGTVIAFGGGVVGDAAGFAAASFLRGVNFVQIPTTVVSMVDSSVGGKTGVDHPLGKNLIGAFYQPKLVCVNTAYLQTLDDFNIRGGFAEVIKYGIIYDAAFFDYLEKNIDGAIALEPEAMLHVIRNSCRIKAEVVSADEHEGGLRAILNYGHTFGHAIESLGEYRERQWHGQAIAIGMCCAADMSVDLGLCTTDEAQRTDTLISRAGLPTRIPADIRASEIYERMFSDKKVAGGKLRFVLMNRIGHVQISADVTQQHVMSVLVRRGAGVSA